MPGKSCMGVLLSCSMFCQYSEASPRRINGILPGGLTPVDRLQGCVRRRRIHATLTLRQCLEQVALLGTDYVLRDEGGTWSAISLLAWIALRNPTRLELPMYLRLPDAQQDGAICELTKRGGFMRLYLIERRFLR